MVLTGICTFFALYFATAAYCHSDVSVARFFWAIPVFVGSGLAAVTCGMAVSITSGIHQIGATHASRTDKLFVLTHYARVVLLLLGYLVHLQSEIMGSWYVVPGLAFAAVFLYIHLDLSLRLYLGLLPVGEWVASWKNVLLGMYLIPFMLMVCNTYHSPDTELSSVSVSGLQWTTGQFERYMPSIAFAFTLFAPFLLSEIRSQISTFMGL